MIVLTNFTRKNKQPQEIESSDDEQMFDELSNEDFLQALID